MDDVLQQRRDMPHVSLTVSTKRADESLRKVAELEVRVNQNVSNPERTEQIEKELQGLYRVLSFFFFLPLVTLTSVWCCCSRHQSP